MNKFEKYKTILCEGNENSLDYMIYSHVFANKKIIPCGAISVLKVRELKHKDNNACAITDRDNLNKDDIKNLEKEDIYALKVRAIENLLVTDEALRKVCDELKIHDIDKNINSIKDILYEKYGKKLGKNFEIEITKENILEFYNPKKVVETVALMLKVSKREYEDTFFKLLKENKIKLQKYIE